MAYEKIASMDPWLVDAIKRIGEGSDWESVFGKSKGKWTPPQYKLPEVPAPAALPQEKAPRVSEFFKENGFLSMFVEGFVPRETQQDYASIVERNMYKGGICVIEAPTGSGKTLAYLVSAANKAVSDSRGNAGNVYPPCQLHRFRGRTVAGPRGCRGTLERSACCRYRCSG